VRFRVINNIATNEEKQQNDYISELRYNHKNHEKILNELEWKQKNSKKKKIQTIDLNKMNQYQFWKYVERLKDFERKEVEFHSSLKHQIVALHDTVGDDNDTKITSHDMLYMKKKNRN
jgi:hypothetical protein